MMRLPLSLFPVIASLLLAACVGSGGEPRRFFVLAEETSSIPAATVGARGSIAVASTTAATFYDTTDIAYSAAPGTRAYYRAASWTEAPADTLGRLLLTSLAADGAFESVTAATSGVRADLLLTTVLLDLHHEAVKAPGKVRVEIAAELIDLRSHALIARRTFVAEASAPTFDAAGAVAGLRSATASALRDIDAWVVATRPAK